jgi:predicted ABC-type ATPase
VPNILIVAGPNGAGKTTFAREYLPAQEIGLEFVNADEIARGLDGPSDMLAGRIMLARMAELVDARANFAIETTLATLSYAQKIPGWRKRDYVVSLIFIGLRSEAESAARVRKRVESGGHDIPEAVLRRRFSKSRRYFETIYKPLVNSWYEWESRDGIFSLVESGASE